MVLVIITLIIIIIIIIINPIFFLRNYDSSVISKLSNSYHEASKIYSYN